MHREKQGGTWRFMVFLVQDSWRATVLVGPWPKLKVSQLFLGLSELQVFPPISDSQVFTGKQNDRDLTKNKTSFFLTCPFYLGCYWKVPSIFEVSLSTPTKVIMTILHVSQSTQMILICYKLTLKLTITSMTKTSFINNKFYTYTYIHTQIWLY